MPDINVWNNEKLNQIKDLITINFADSKLETVLSEIHYASLPSSVRDLAHHNSFYNEMKKAAIELARSHGSQEQIDADIKGIEATFESFKDEFGNYSNPDYMDLAEYLTPEEITSLYNSAFALAITSNILTKETLEKYPEISQELTVPENARSFLGLFSVKVAQSIGADKIAHKVMYSGQEVRGQRNFPIVDLKASQYPEKSPSGKVQRYDAKRQLEKYYKEFEQIMASTNTQYSPEAMKTIFAYCVLEECKKIKEESNYKEYCFKPISNIKDAETWGEILNKFELYLKQEYLPKSCFLMSDNVFSMRKELDDYELSVNKFCKENNLRINANRTLSKDAGIDKVVVQVHHIFPHAKYEKYCDQWVNFSCLTPSDHLGIAHPNNDTKKEDPDFRKYLLYIKFIECVAGNIDKCKLTVKEGWPPVALLDMLDDVYQTKDFTQIKLNENLPISKQAIQFAEVLSQHTDNLPVYENPYIRKHLITTMFNEIYDDQKVTYDGMTTLIKANPEKYLSSEFIDNIKTVATDFDDKRKVFEGFISDLRQSGNDNRPDKDELKAILSDNIVKDFKAFTEGKPQTLTNTNKAFESLSNAIFQAYITDNKQPTAEGYENYANDVYKNLHIQNIEDLKSRKHEKAAQTVEEDHKEFFSHNKTTLKNILDLDSFALEYMPQEIKDIRNEYESLQASSSYKDLDEMLNSLTEEVKPADVIYKLPACDIVLGKQTKDGFKIDQNFTLEYIASPDVAIDIVEKINSLNPENNYVLADFMTEDGLERMCINANDEEYKHLQDHFASHDQYDRFTQFYGAEIEL